MCVCSEIILHYPQQNVRLPKLGMQTTSEVSVTQKSIERQVEIVQDVANSCY